MTAEDFELQRQQAVQAALGSLANSSNDELKLETGNNHIRILPRLNADGTRNFQFWNTVSVHWGVGPQKRAIACSRQFGKPCVLCEHLQQLRAAGNVEQADSMRAKDTHLIGVSPTADPNTTKYVRCAATVMEGILKYANDPNWGCPSDPESGYPINISKSGSGQKGTKYQVQAAPNKGPIDAALLSSLPDLTGVFPDMSPEETRALLFGSTQQVPAPNLGTTEGAPSLSTVTPPPLVASALPQIPVASAPPQIPVASAPPAIPVASAPAAIPSAPPPPPSASVVGVTGTENQQILQTQAPPFEVPS